ncbi:MAG: TlpA disulfide reductase family protein [Gammaproteobacteria bacterium]|nr:TlpA disulfide reductase family protein [Gammaproteobacteria bacterium]
MHKLLPHKLTLALVALVIPAFAVTDVEGVDGEDESKSIGSMQLEGDTSAVYNNGRFQIYVPEASRPSGFVSIAPTTAAASQKNSDGSKQETNEAGQVTKTTIGSSMATPVSMSASKTSSVSASSMVSSSRSGTKILAEAPIVDGKFSLSYEVSEVLPVYFHVLDARTESGMRMAPVKGQQFIVEPGELTLTMDERARFVVEGGKYNDAVFNSWKQSDAYVEADQDYQAMLKEPEPATEEDRKAQAEARRLQFEKILKLESDGRQEVALNDPDPLTRRLTLQTTWLVMGNWVSEALKELKEMAPNDPWVAMRIEQDKKSQELAAQRDRIAVGTPILDFNAVDLDGSPVKLSDIQKESKLVLLEFWASWCGPCRTEIPHLKEAYEKFKDKGFEIVSFTIDDSQEAWELASEEESLPWPNLGIGREAEAATTYTVTGVPYNLLFDAQTGEIIEKNLRGLQLDAELEKFFM